MIALFSIPYLYIFGYIVVVLSISPCLSPFYSSLFFFFYLCGDHRDLHVLRTSFPTRRSSDLRGPISPRPIGGAMTTELPLKAKPYKRTPSFTEATIPAGLLGDHSTKAGTWGLIRVEEGLLRYIVQQTFLNAEDRKSTRLNSSH